MKNRSISNNWKGLSWNNNEFLQVADLKNGQKDKIILQEKMADLGHFTTVGWEDTNRTKNEYQFQHYRLWVVGFAHILSKKWWLIKLIIKWMIVKHQNKNGTQHHFPFPAGFHF